ncbi:MAG: AAA family ATPase [Alphaproteobacteria bacterium]|nr:AAA family ATPase [Alphaproteobacteria bacterium]
MDERVSLDEYRQKSRLKLVPFDDIKLATDRNYLVKGWVPGEGLVIVWGAPKCGKSFLTFDMVMHIALGWKYRGCKVVQGPVVYLAAEGAHGFKARIEAFRQRHLPENHEPPAFYLVGASIDLIGDRTELIGAIEVAGCDPVAVVIDTLNRSLVGSESRDEDMARYIQAADAIRERFHCAVIIVHHCGIADNRPRGHTSLTGAADAQIAVRRDGNNNIVATLEWMKDGPEGETLTSALEVVDVGIDDDGDPITSCVVVEAEASEERTYERLTGRQRRAVDALANVLIDAGQPAPDATHYPSGATVVQVETWRETLFKAGVLDRDASNPRQPFKRLKDTLTERGVIGEWNGLVWVVRTDADV